MSKSHAVKALINQLDNGDEVDRCYAAQALGRMRDAQALEPLYRHLQDEDLDVCIDAATALGQIGNEDAINGLIEALHYHGEPDVKQAAVEGLSGCTSARGVAALTHLLERPDDIQWRETEGWDDWWDLQRQVVKALGDHGIADAAPALANLLDSDDGQDIESEVLKALVLIGQRGLAELKARLDSAPTRRLRRIATALTYGSSTEAEALLSELLAHPDSDVRQAATLSLIAGTANDRLRTLVTLLNDPAPEVQASALKGLEKLQPRDSHGLDDNQLVDMLNADDSRVRCAALKILSQRTTPAGSASQGFNDRLLAGLNSHQQEEQLLCCELLAATAQTDAVGALRALAEDEDSAVIVRRRAVQTIGELGLRDGATLETLWACSQTANTALRHVSLQALLTLNAAPEADPEAPQPLTLLLKALAGTPVEWQPTPPTEDKPQQKQEQEQEQDAQSQQDQPQQQSQQDSQRIPLLAIDEQDASSDPQPASAPPGIEQILASLSDAYPAALEEASEEAPIGSTLASITRSNIEATVGPVRALSSDSERILGLVDELPEEYRAFAEVVHTNARTGERMIKDKRRKPEEIEADRRILSARVLGDCGQVQVLQPLLACLMDDDAELRREAADSLGRLAANHPDLPGIGNMLGPIATQLRAGNEEIRVACARTLGALKHRAAVPALLAALDDPDTLVRIQAIRSLTAISAGKGKPLSANDHVVLSEVTPDRITRAILDCQGDPEIGVRKAVIDALVGLRGLDLELLLKLGLEEGGALTLAAAQALSALAPDAATEKLIQALDVTDDSSIRRLAIQMLQEIHGPAAA